MWECIRKICETVTRNFVVKKTGSVFNDPSAFCLHVASHSEKFLIVVFYERKCRIDVIFDKYPDEETMLEAVLILKTNLS